MRILIIKLGATGDVVRTTSLLNVLRGEIHWLTNTINLPLLNTLFQIDQSIVWNDRNLIKEIQYDLIINLEDSFEVAYFVQKLQFTELFGAHLDKTNNVIYTESSKEWFDLSLISKFGKNKADELKFKNRKTYQELIFNGLGYNFNGETYILPEFDQTELVEDIAIAQTSGSIWPMKNWNYYGGLKNKLEQYGHKVNFLQQRATLQEHIDDIRRHKFLISGDSLPMHIALGSGLKCLTLFLCTSPWEIYDYDTQKKVISPTLKRFFYKRNFDTQATTSIPLDIVYNMAIQYMV